MLCYVKSVEVEVEVSKALLSHLSIPSLHAVRNRIRQMTPLPLSLISTRSQPLVPFSSSSLACRPYVINRILWFCNYYYYYCTKQTPHYRNNGK